MSDAILFLCNFKALTYKIKVYDWQFDWGGRLLQDNKGVYRNYKEIFFI